MEKMILQHLVMWDHPREGKTPVYSLVNIGDS